METLGNIKVEVVKDEMKEGGWRLQPGDIEVVGIKDVRFPSSGGMLLMGFRVGVEWANIVSERRDQVLNGSARDKAAVKMYECNRARGRLQCACYRYIEQTGSMSHRLRNPLIANGWREIDSGTGV